MSRLSRAEIDAFTRQLDGLSKASRAVLSERLSAMEFSSVADLRERLIEAMDPLIREASRIAASYAAEFYETVRESALGGRYTARVYDGYDADATAGAVRAMVNPVANGARLSSIAAALLSRVDYGIMRAAGECVTMNAKMDGSCIGWARVPSGAETCAFCLMLASFGPQYHSEVSAGSDGHYHANCDCRIVPWFDGMTVDGYDPDGMYARFNECLDALGGRDGIASDWYELPKEERERLAVKAGGKPWQQGEAYRLYFNRRVTKEISKHDPEWFMTGKRRG